MLLQKQIITVACGLFHLLVGAAGTLWGLGLVLLSGESGQTSDFLVPLPLMLAGILFLVSGSLLLLPGERAHRVALVSQGLGILCGPIYFLVLSYVESGGDVRPSEFFDKINVAGYFFLVLAILVILSLIIQMAYLYWEHRATQR